MKRHRLTEAEIATALAAHPDWTLREGRFCRELRFGSFSEAFAFMTRVALLAEQLDHHPDWSNSYRTVRIELTTHDLGALSTLDVALVERIDALL